jgi:hypothetical protein
VKQEQLLSNKANRNVELLSSGEDDFDVDAQVDLHAAN